MIARFEKRFNTLADISLFGSFKKERRGVEGLMRSSWLYSESVSLGARVICSLYRSKERREKTDISEVMRKSIVAFRLDAMSQKMMAFSLFGSRISIWIEQKIEAESRSIDWIAVASSNGLPLFRREG